MSMRKYLNFSTILLMAIIGLSGCGMGFSGALPTAAAQPPLSPTDWPTPMPTPLAPSPTPFPMITLAVTPTPTVMPTPTPVSFLPTGTGADQLMTQASATGGLAPVAVALVTGNDVSIRRGPGERYATVGTVQPGEMAAVFGKNQTGDWLYGLTVSEFQGWLPASSVRALGSLDQAPVLPPNPLDVLAAGPTPAVAENPTRALSELKTVTTAQVNVAALNVRQGPGAGYDRLDTLTHGDQVSLQALNPPQDWALIKMVNGQQGWVALPYLTVDQAALADAPVVKPSILSQVPIASQVAQPAEVIQAVSTGSSPVAIPASQLSVTTNNNLTPITTAHINTNEVAVRPEPGTGHAPIDTITDNQESIDVLALDASRQWALVQPAFSHPGWVPLNALTVPGSLANAPQAITAWVNSNAIEVRRGPGIYDDVIGNLAINSLILVLGLDETQSWALVEPIVGGGSGWVPIQFLTFSEPLADIPLAPASSPAEQLAVHSQPSGSPLSPSRSISQSKLVFQLASGGDIMVINPDGSGLRRLTHGIDPVLSPDGQMVAFTRWEGETGSLWLINIDGSNEHSILGFTKQAKGPAWSPDGSQIVLNYQHEGRLNEKRECVNLAKHKNARPPRNASDVKISLKDHTPYLCWTIPPDPHWGLRVVNVADGSFEDLDGGTYAFRPTWDPNQSWRIVDDGGMGLVTVDRIHNVPHHLTENIQDGSPVFSPDGRYLAATAGQQGGSQGYDIFRLNADGSGRVRLTQTPLWVPVVPGNFKQWNNVSPAWSPDGSQIAFLTDRTGRWEIWVMNADGSDQHPLFSEEVNNQLQFSYNFVDERVLSWR